MTTYSEAIDIIFAKFKDVWSGSVAIVGYEPEIYWPNSEENESPDLDKYWVRVSQETLEDEQSAFKNSNAVKLYDTKGFVYIELFCPKSDNEVSQNSRALAVLVRNGFREPTSGVWFRNSKIKEVAIENNYYRLNVIADYEYDERY